MKKVTFLILLLLCYSLSNYAQSNEKLKFRSFGYGFGFFSTSANEGGVSGILEIGISYNKNLFLFNYLSGSTFNLFGPPGVNVSEFSFQVGRELKASSWFSVEGYAGLGNFSQESKQNYLKQISVLSVPLRLKLICYTSKHFALISNSNIALNSFSNNFSSNLTFQHNF